MSWFKIDDQAAFDAKVVQAGNEAFGAWTRAGAWCSAHLTDGLIPRAVALQIAPLRVWRRLVDAVGHSSTGLVVEAPDGAYKIHNFLAYNPSSAEVKGKREKTRKKLENWRTKRSGNQPCNPVTDLVTDPTCNQVTTQVSNPVGNRDVTLPPIPIPIPIPEIPPGGGIRADAREAVPAEPPPPAPPPRQDSPPGSRDPWRAEALAAARAKAPSARTVELCELARRIEADGSPGEAAKAASIRRQAEAGKTPSAAQERLLREIWAEIAMRSESAPKAPFRPGNRPPPSVHVEAPSFRTTTRVGPGIFEVFMAEQQAKEEREKAKNQNENEGLQR